MLQNTVIVAISFIVRVFKQLSFIMTIEQIVNELNYLEEKGNWSDSELQRVNELELMFINHALADNYGIDFKKGTFYLKS